MLCKISNIFNGAMGVHNVAWPSAWHLDILYSTLATIHMYGFGIPNILLHENPLHPSTRWQKMTIQSTLSLVNLEWSCKHYSVLVTISHWVTLYNMLWGHNQTNHAQQAHKDTHGPPTTFHQGVPYIQPKFGTMILNPNMYCHYLTCFVM